ncbi:MAG: type II secretion system F family protein [Prevotellaceae bacterium]|jgi:type IV pilus assembly protein PilC|nr:type II secretion system F family protein [Prevotellaceae bacterium]
MTNQRNNISDILGKLTEHPVKDSKKEILFSELNSLLSSGLDFSHSFELLISSENDRKIKIILQELYNRVISGYSLWQAVENCGKFSKLDSGVIRIGEQTGRLNDAFGFLSDYYHKKIHQRRLILSAIRYPLIIFATAVTVVIFMLSFIVPMFEQVYIRLGGELPSLTKWIISASKSFPNYIAVFMLIAASVAIPLYIYKDTEKVRSIMSTVLLKIPVAGTIMKRNTQAHFCKLLYLLISSGVPLLHSLQMLADIITFYPYQRSFKSIANALQHGEMFTANLEKYDKLYDKKLTALLRVGEETNRLPQMLNRQAEELTKNLEYLLKKLGDILEPALIVFVGAMVAIILISMYLPMFKLGGIMG